MKLSLAPVRRVTTSTASARPRAASLHALPTLPACAPSRLEPAFAPMRDAAALHR